jgi:hypothetical protein
MGSQRDQEMQRGPRAAQRARGLTFDCPACRRPAECPGLPTVAEDGHTRLSDSEIREIYNLRRYEHYLRDFGADSDLREHLVSRAHYWAVDDQKLLADHLASVDATIAWWLIAHRRQVEDQRRAQGRLTV